MGRAGLALLMVYAAVGLVVSLFVHVTSFFATPPGGNTLFVALHVGIFPLWLPIVFVANAMMGRPALTGGRASFGEWNALLARAPPILRWMTIGFFIYALVNFAWFLLTTIGAPHAAKAGDPPFSVWHGFSGHWMAFYAAGLTIATTAYLQGAESIGRRCPNGHFVRPDDSFCPRCGRAVGRL